MAIIHDLETIFNKFLATSFFNIISNTIFKILNPSSGFNGTIFINAKHIFISKSILLLEKKNARYILANGPATLHKTDEAKIR